MTLHELLRYLSLSAQYATKQIAEKGADDFLDHFEDGKPDTILFKIGDKVHELPRSLFRKHDQPNVKAVSYEIESDIREGESIDFLTDDDDDLRAIDVTMKRGLLRNAATLKMKVTFEREKQVEAIDLVHEKLIDVSEGASDGKPD